MDDPTISTDPVGARPQEKPPSIARDPGKGPWYGQLEPSPELAACLARQAEEYAAWLAAQPKPIPRPPKHLRRAVPANLRGYVDPMFRLVPQRPRVAVEIGSKWGWWAWRCLHALPDCTLYCVDPWKETTVDYREWRINMEPFLKLDRVMPVRMTSEKAALIFTLPIDLLFIDGCHEPEAVAQDILLWWPKVRTNGVLVGHDWGGYWGPKVREGVQRVWKREEFNVDRLYHSGKHLGKCFWRRKEAEKARGEEKT